MRVLFVNCCIESKTTSKTYLLANSFIETFIQENPGAQITQFDLASERLSPLTYHDVIMREKGNWQRSHYAQQIVQHDRIIIAAPMSDWGSPSLLKVYIEHICLPGSTYKHTEHGYTGLCSGKKVFYISAMNGQTPSGVPSDAEYLREVFKLLGIEDFKQLCIDIVNNPHAGGMSQLNIARKDITEMATAW